MVPPVALDRSSSFSSSSSSFSSSSSMLIIDSQSFRLPEASAAAGRPPVPPVMIAFFRKWRRSKSLLRSSSGPCYPYPRSHSTVMVVPSGRPSTEEPATQKKTQQQQPRRRPPLNRAIPTIPESKSNESIMSHASRVSHVQQEQPVAPSVDCVVIENRAATERLHLASGKETAMRRATATEKKNSSPRSPLMNVAHTVRDKLSRLTKRKNTSATSASSSSAGVRSSQSFPGFRAPPPSASRVDENSNRVIKSSSMEAPLSERPSTSKVIIPQCPEPLFAEEMSETGELSSSMVPTTAPVSTVTEGPSSSSFSPDAPVVRVSMKADMLVVTELAPVTEQHTTVIVAERPRELPISVVYSPEEPKKEEEETIIKEDKENDRPREETKVTIVETKETNEKQKKDSRKEEERERRKSPERFVMTVKTPETQRKHRKEREEIVERVEERVVEEEPSKERGRREESKSPERFVMTVKSPEPQRNHKVFMVQQKSTEEPPVVETRGRTEQRRMEEKKKKKKTTSLTREETKSPERYVMTVKTPEPLRKHKVLTIGDAPPTAATTTESKKMTRSRSEERPTMKIWTSLRKSLALRRTQTFSTTSVEQENVEVRERPQEKEEKEDEGQKKERFVILTKTPQFLRRHHTFMVGERPRSPDVPWIEEGQLTEPIATVGPTKKKRTRSEEPRKQEEEAPERFVMTARTPLTMRKYQTFVVETKKTPQLPTSMSADAVEQERRGDVLLKELDAIYPTSSKLEFKDSQEVEPKISPKDMYVLTSMTPQLRRRDEVSSPTLFVLHKRPSERPLDEENNRKLEAVREMSQSDRAELRHASSGDLTSFEEDIPMDTAAEEHVRPVVAVLPLTSRPVASSPKTTRKKKKASVATRLATQTQNQRDHRLLRGLRNAGKIFSPSFLKHKKTPPPVSAHVSSTLFSSSSSPRAPLAEFESSVVANSPMVEALPIETWNMPRPRGSPPRGYAALIREEIDANGNPQQEESCAAPSSPQLHRGLIDDEILDQPMLVGDSFSHSESSDRLSERAQEWSGTHFEQQRRADVAPTATVAPRSELVDQSLSQVADLKSQLLDLQSLLNENPPPPPSDPSLLDALARENDSLRRQLHERDQLIEQLRGQLAQLRPLPVSL